MFDIGWTEILILATISLFVIGPKDIPKFFGYIGSIIAKIRNITSEFKETVDDAIKDSELEDIKKEISLSDPDFSNNLFNNSSEEKKVKNLKEKAIENKSNLSHKENQKFAGPTENLPSGLKHIREQNENEEKDNKSKGS